MNNNRKRLVLVALSCAALVILSVPAMAAPVAGTLQLSGTLTIGTTFLNFCPVGPVCPAAPGNWNVPGGGTGDLNTPYADDPNGGLITSLNNTNEPVGTLLPGNGVLFLTFAASGSLPVPDIQFFITELFPGVGGTAGCGAAAAPGQTCTPIGSALTFLNGNGGNSSATITAVGVARRISTNEFDPLQVVITSQFNAPFQSVLSLFAAFGQVNATYSASFTATAPSVGPPTPLTITTTSAANGTVGTAYSQNLIATGGTTPYSWSIVRGRLPVGLTLDRSSGQILGTPGFAGTSIVTFQVTDSGSPSQTATVTLAFTIN